MEAFASILRGTITEDNSNEIIKISSILSTTLVDTKELTFLNGCSTSYLQYLGADSFVNWAGPPRDLQGALAQFGKMDVSSVPQANRLASNRSLADALEEMFRNLTISLMSSDLLR
jgi:hypothetical protein